MTASPTTESDVAIVVETAAGTFLRRIPNASPLTAGTKQGKAAEDATHDAAARWGLPDFIYRSGTLQRASGTRELGDGLIVVRALGAVIQVKSRALPALPDRAREASWITKNAAKAARQAAGTVRALRQPQALRNFRGREVTIDGGPIDWVCVTVIDHPSPPGDIVLEARAAGLPLVPLLRREWEFLFEQLRSVHAVLEYLHRVAQDDSPITLGQEHRRYYELAAADHDAVPSALRPADFLGPRARLGSQPILPMAPASARDEQAQTLFRILLEDVATAELDDQGDAGARLEVLAHLDALPVLHREDVGALLLEQIMAMGARPASPALAWKIRTVQDPSTNLQLLFVVCSVYSDLTRRAFESLVQLRHHTFNAAGPGKQTIALMLTPRPDGARRWDTTVMALAGDIELDDDAVDQLTQLWGIPDTPRSPRPTYTRPRPGARPSRRRPAQG